jgi:hypothetical protein
LQSYEDLPNKDFWASFPSAALPGTITSRIATNKLKACVDKVKHVLTKTELARAEKCLDYLSNGAPSFQKVPLGPCLVKNSSASLMFGPEVTDSIASWIKKGFVAGPFSSPPLPKFRANSILAIPQPDKVRVCINVSMPTGNSFNSNIDKSKLEKVIMTSAKLFSFSILECGPNSKMWKFDFEDAYKNVPTPLADLRLQGFCWLNQYFVELKQMFGSAASVQNFDILANTIKTCSIANCDIPRKLVHRQLDDVPLVTPHNTMWGEMFEQQYRSLCEEIGMVLAPNCKNFEKAFSNSTFGKVLGIFFETKTLSWKLPFEKSQKIINLIHEVENKEKISLLDLQILMGNLNHVGQMLPFLSNFKFNLNSCLASFTPECAYLPLPPSAKVELKVWKNFLLDNVGWFPISHPQHPPPICTKVFFTDAAGFSSKSRWSGNIGCGVVGLNENQDTLLAFQFWWPKKFITEAMDNKGKRFGDKTATLEQIAILLPLLLIPECLFNQHIIVRTDNIACVFGQENHLMKNDETASIFIRTVNLISAFLGSKIHVEHLPRCSDWGSEMADNLSRERTTGFLETRMLQRWQHLEVPIELITWLQAPTSDWDLPFKLLQHAIEKTS